MKRRFADKRKAPWLVAAVLCFAAALFFSFALIGYRTAALLLASIGVCILLYLLLPKKFRIMLTVLLCIGVLVFAAAETPVVKAAKGTPEMDADYLIVLGAGVNGSVPSLSMLNRLNAALDYLDAHPDCTAVVSGGQGPGEALTEAEAMFRWLTEHGVAPERILREEQSTSTAENLKFSFALIGDTENVSAAVCSSEYHLYRAEYLAKQLGVEVGGVPARTSLPILKLNYFIREAFGVAYLWVFG